MSKTHDRKIGVNDKSDYTKIMFQPDLAKFHMTELDKDIVALLSRRAYDLAGSSPKVKVYLNGRVIPVKNFKDYVQLYLCNAKEENGEPLTVVHEQVNPRWEICLTSSDKGFQQISFANSIATTKGGRHVDYVIDQVTKKLIEVVKRKNKGGVDVKPYQIKNHCWLFVNCLIENPTFDSQTKENMTLQSKKFGSKCNLTEKFLKQASSSGIVDNIMNWVKFKAQSQLQKKSAGKSNKLKGVPKLDDANDAGTKNSLGCTLILTEGDSAKTLAVSGLSVIGRDKYGVFPLRGKLLNVRDASHKQIMDNAEINNIIKIMGLKYNKKYEADDDLKTLRYGKLMIMTDQDHDGSHIKGLLINFIHSNWPHMLQRRVLEEFITPIVKVTKGSQVLSFYTIPEFEDWQANIGNPKSWKVKYYKGLGTSTSKEAKAYFADMLRHRVRFKYSGPEDDGCIDMAFNKKRADDRKDWLTNFMDERRRCREDSRPEPGSDLYSANTRTLSYKDFVNKELVMFSYADLERSVPSLVDGLKPGQRKVLYTCLRRNDKREVKVAQLAGSVAELSAYHHGEVSLQTTIINMAQNFVGSNNLNLLQPIGQFGTRLYGGKDSASPRYIFTMLSPLTRLLFPSVDDNLLTFNYDDSQKVEPTWYCPIIPMILVNGSEGIGTGWSTRIPNHDIREVVENCKRLMRDEEPKQMFPSYKNFRGTIQEIESNRYVISGEAAILDDSTFEITELPVRTWTQNYKENVLEPMAMGNEKVPQQIQDYKEYNTDTSVRFVITMTQQKLKEVDKKGLHKFMSVQTSFSVNNTLVLFDEFGCLRKFNNTLDILKEFFQLRLKLYEKRKHYLIGMLTADALKLKNQARFIVEKIEGKISIFNKAKKLLIQLLLEKKYDSDPVKAWKDSLKEETTEGSDEETQEDEETEDAKGSDYNYILNMPLWSLTKERKEDLLKQRDAKQKELEELMKKTPKMMWNDDLDKFMEELEKVEQKERDDDAAFVGSGKAATLGKGKKSKMKELAETKPSSQGLRIEPVVDEDMKKRLTTVDKKPSKAKLKRELEAKKLENGSGEAVVATSLTPVDDIDLDEPPSLMSRIIKSAEKKPAPRPRMKQSVLGFKAKPTKRNPWESSGSDSDEESAGEFGSTDFASDLAPREITKRATKIAATKKFTIDSDSFSSSDDEEIKDVVIAKETEKDEPVQVLASSASDDDFSKPSRDWNEVMGNSPIKSNAEKIPIKRKKMTASSGTTSSDGSSDKPARKMAKTTKKNDGKAKAKKPVTKPANKPLVSDSDDDAVIAVTSWTGSVAKTKKATKAKPKSTKAAPKKKNAPKRNAWSGSDDDNDDDELMIIESPIQPRSTPARRKPKAKYIFDDDEDDDDKDDDFKEADDDEDDDEDDDFKENDYDEDCA